MHSKPDRLKADAETIRLLGGPAALAARLGYKVQRVHNWMTRGIPPAEKLNRPELFSRLPRPADPVPTEQPDAVRRLS